MTNDLAIGTEVWGFIEKPWAEGKTIIAKEGYVWLTRWETNKPYIITKFFDNKGNLLGIYCDITKPVRRTKEGFEFDDIYLDVWQIPGYKPIILDEDELSEAVKLGYISTEAANEARIVAEGLVKVLNQPANNVTSF
jgi:predicted RNA-binding protein associated with RNAse of E/G family